MVYETLLLIGLVGIVAQAVLGTAGHAHAHGAHGLSHGGHAAAHGGHAAAHGGHAAAHGGHAPGHAVSHHGHNAAPQARSGGFRGRSASWLFDILSPLTLFSLCLGVGATGLLLRPLRLINLEHAALAVLGGLLFYALLVKPLWTVIFQFASEPAKALDGAVAETAEALSHFDASGKGLVRVTVDGQLVRVLAYLDSDDRADAGTVQPGDQLTIISVDGRANTCRVARL